jgi:hypothetical protein
MHTFIRLDVPFTLVFIVRRLGKKIRLLTLCACETVEPDVGCLPHTSHVFAIKRPPENFNYYFLQVINIDYSLPTFQDNCQHRANYINYKP